YREQYGQRPSPAKLLQLRQQATLETRSSKPKTMESLAVKMSDWRDRTLATGHDPSAIISAATGHARSTVTPDMLTEDVRNQLAHSVLSETAARRSTFTKANLIA